MGKNHSRAKMTSFQLFIYVYLYTYIHLKVYKQKIINTNKPNKKWAKDLNSYFSKKDVQMTS